MDLPGEYGNSQSCTALPIGTSSHLCSPFFAVYPEHPSSHYSPNTYHELRSVGWCLYLSLSNLLCEYLLCVWSYFHLRLCYPQQLLTSRRFLFKRFWLKHFIARTRLNPYFSKISIQSFFLFYLNRHETPNVIFFITCKILSPKNTGLDYLYFLYKQK